MAVQVIFFTPKGIGHVAAPGVGKVRVREAVTIPGSTNATAQDGEVVVVFNGEASPVLAAFGSAPDAASIAETPATSAGMAIPSAELSAPFVVRTGDKVSVKALA